MFRRQIAAVSGTEFEAVAGYVRAMRMGRRVVVSGTSWNGAVPARSVDDEFRGICETISSALEKVGSGLEDVIVTRIFLAPGVAWEDIARLHKEMFGQKARCNTMLYVFGLIGEGASVEMEVEATIPFARLVRRRVWFGNIQHKG